MSATPERVPRGPLWLGRAIRATAPLWLALGRLESRALRGRLRPVDRPIYIAGLPRAGTTISPGACSCQRAPSIVTCPPPWVT